MICFAFFFAIYFFSGIHYAVNDDIAMRDIASGIRSGTPDGHLVYIKYPLGWLISRFYIYISGNVDWYGLFLLNSLLLSASIVLYCIYCNVKNRHIRICLVISNFLVLMRHVFFFQWTICAAFCGIAGVMFYYSISCESRSYRIFQKIVTIFLLLLCYMIRDKVFFIVIVFSVPMFVHKEWIGRKKIGGCIKGCMIFFAAVFVCMCSVEKIHTLAYQEIEWQKYIEFNKMRSLLYDYYAIPDYSENRIFYEQSSISENTYCDLKRYSYLYNPSIDGEMLKKIVDYNKCIEEDQIKGRGINTLLEMRDIFIAPQYSLINIGEILLFISFIFLVIKHKRCDLAVLGICEITIWISILYYLVFKGRYPSHIIYTMGILFLLQFQSILLQLLTEYKIERLRLVVALCGMGVLIFVFNNLILDSREINAKNYSYVQVKNYIGNHASNIYILPSTTFAKYTDCFEVLKRKSQGKILTTGGWVCRSPLIQEQLNRANIKEIPNDFINNDNVYILEWSEENLEYVTASLSEICEKEVECKISDIIEVVDGKMNVYKLYFE